MGLKVDVQALPHSLQTKLRAGKVNLDDPATTLALLELNSVVGVTGFFDNAGRIKSLGIQCALCHSTVDEAVVRTVLNSWGLAQNLRRATASGRPETPDSISLIIPACSPGLDS